jgi:hypothetical protein
VNSDKQLIVEGAPAERASDVHALAAKLNRAVRVESAQSLLSTGHWNHFIQSLKTADPNSAILFFDEADALFGKRSDVKDSHDRYAQLENSFKGLIVFGVSSTSNLMPEMAHARKHHR